MDEKEFVAAARAFLQAPAASESSTRRMFALKQVLDRYGVRKVACVQPFLRESFLSEMWLEASLSQTVTTQGVTNGLMTVKEFVDASFAFSRAGGDPQLSDDRRAIIGHALNKHGARDCEEVPELLREDFLSEIWSVAGMSRSKSKDASAEAPSSVLTEMQFGDSVQTTQAAAVSLATGGVRLEITAVEQIGLFESEVRSGHTLTLPQVIQLRDFLNRHIDGIVLDARGVSSERSSDDPAALPAEHVVSAEQLYASRVVNEQAFAEGVSERRFTASFTEGLSVERHPSASGTSMPCAAPPVKGDHSWNQTCHWPPAQFGAGDHVPSVTVPPSVSTKNTK